MFILETERLRLRDMRLDDEAATCGSPHPPTGPTDESAWSPQR